MASISELKEICYSFYTGEGWKISKNKKIHIFSLAFDILIKNKTKIALYTTSNKLKIEKLIRVATAIKLFPNTYKLNLCVPSSMDLNSRTLIELGNAEIEVITAMANEIKTLHKRNTQKSVDRARLSRMIKNITDINLISTTNPRLQFKIFDIDDQNEILKQLKMRVNNKNEYIVQILNLCCFLDKINKKEIKKLFNPPKKINTHISVLEFALSERGIKVDKDIFESFRKLRILRTEFPVHVKKTKKDLKELDKIKKEFAGIKDPSEQILWEAILQKLSWCLDSLKEGVKI